MLSIPSIPIHFFPVPLLFCPFRAVHWTTSVDIGAKNGYLRASNARHFHPFHSFYSFLPPTPFSSISWAIQHSKIYSFLALELQTSNLIKMLPSMGSKMVLERDELIKFVEKELICTIGSADAPCTIPVLITLFREDTGKDIEQLAKRLNYTSIQAMLESDEFRHIIEPCVTALAKGAGNNNPKEVYCYKLKPRDDFAHILTSIEQQQLSKEEEQRNKLKLFISNPKNRELALEGKERILHCLHKLGAENEAVPLVKLQQQYPAVWGVGMDKKELKKWFPTGKVQQIVFDFLYDEIETHEAQGQQGSLFFKMRKSFEEAMEGIEDSRKKFEEAKQMAEGMKRKKKGKGIGIVQVRVNVQVQQQPKKKEKKPMNLMVIQPKMSIPNQLPKPKPVPILQKKDGIKTSKFATDDPEFFIQVKKAGEFTANQKAEELFDEICRMSDQLEEANEENGKNKYTQMAEGAEATDSEAEFDENDEDEEKENYVMNRWMKQLNSLNNTSTSSSSSNNNAGPSKKAGDGQRMTLERAKQIQLAHQREYFALAKKDQEKSRKTCGQFVRQATSKKVGKLRKIQWTGRRAKEAAVRKERQENLLAKLQAKWIADGMPKKEIFSRKLDTKAMLASLLSQMLWAHNHLGVTEAERMLRLLLFNYDFEVNVKELVKERIPIAKFFCGPEEEEYITFKYNVNGVLDGTAGYKKKKKLAAAH